MPLSLDEVQNIAESVSSSDNLDFQLGVVSALYAATEDADARQKLATSLVYLQTRMVNDTMAAVTSNSRTLMQSLGITSEQMELAGSQVREMIQKEKEREQSSSENTQE